MENTYCVYMHTNKTNNKKYIGITKHLNPWRRWGRNGQGYDHCVIFYSAIQKYGFDNFEHTILHTGLSKQEAYDKEKYYIGLYKSNNNQYGYNISAGGQGSNDVHPSEETRRKISQKLMGHKPANFNSKVRQRMREAHLGKKLTEEHKKNISRSLGQGVNNVNYGRKHSAEYCLKQSLLKSGKNHPNYGKHLSETTKERIRKAVSKPVLQLSLDGNIIREWESGKEAANKLNLSYKSINRCLNLKGKTSGGYIWKYK